MVACQYSSTKDSCRIHLKRLCILAQGDDNLENENLPGEKYAFPCRKYLNSSHL